MQMLSISFLRTESGCVCWQVELFLLLTYASLSVWLVAVFVGLLFGGVALMNMQESVDAQAAEIIAQVDLVKRKIIELYEDDFRRIDPTGTASGRP